MFNLTGDTEVTPAIQKGMAILGHMLTRAAEESSPTDDSPHKITQDEKLGLLGDAAKAVMGNALGN